MVDKSLPINLNAAETQLLEKLKAAQDAQGNMEELQIQKIDDDDMSTDEAEYMDPDSEDDCNFSVDVNKTSNFVFLFPNPI